LIREIGVQEVVMRRLSVLVVCVLLFSIAGSAVADDDLLVNFWKEQREAAKAQQRQAAAASGRPMNKSFVGLEFGTTAHDLLAKAQPDECYTEIGGPSGTPPCSGDSQPKVNQAYVWGMVDVGSDIWFGTVANTHCLVLSTMIGQALGGGFPPMETNSWVCEFGGATYDPLGDHRAPEIYVWHSATGTLENKFSDMGAAGQALLADVVGIRAAGTSDGVVLLAGVMTSGGVAMFAFETNGAYISQTIMPWADVRKFAVLNDELYVGIGLPTEGQVLRWTGDVDSPFAFELVAAFAGEMVAELVAHEGVLAAGTWPIPGVLAPPNTAGVWTSPDPLDGIVDAGDGDWLEVWQVSDYEPDPVNAAVTGVGGMASYGGNLYWGTMHPPFLSTAAHWGLYSDFYDAVEAAGGAIEEFLIAAFLGNHRATSFWMGQNLGLGGISPPPPIILHLLYGLPALPVFTPGPMPTPPDIPYADQYWDIVDTGWVPVWGISGFGNLFNNYAWSATVNNGRLWVGTMDWIYLLQDLGMAVLTEFLESEGITLEEFLIMLEAELGIPNFAGAILRVLTGDTEFLTTSGADLYYFPLPDAPAFPESWGGIDNYSSYGVRNMLSMGGSVYAGMANPMNLLTDTTDNVPEGGWELIRLDDLPPNTPTGEEVTVNLEDGSQITLCDVTFAGYTVGIWLPLARLPALIPPPPGRVPTTNLMLVGTSANAIGCGPDTMARVCVPDRGGDRGLYQLQMIDTPDGPIPGWVEITTTRQNGLLCGEMNAAYQDVMWMLGYHGYLGIVAAFAGPPIPDSGPFGWAVLIVLIGIAAVIAIRMRMG
jgi:hypothetical protein